MSKTSEPVEIDGIDWYPDVVGKMEEPKFIDSHISLIPFKNMDKKEATNKLKNIFKQLKK